MGEGVELGETATGTAVVINAVGSKHKSMWATHSKTGVTAAAR